MTMHSTRKQWIILTSFCFILFSTPAVAQISPLQQVPAFGNVLLDTLIRKAVVNNYNLLNAVNSIGMAKAQLRMAQSGFYPTIGVSGSYTLEKTSLGVQHIDQRDNIGEVLATMSWEIDIFGKIRKGAKAQKQLYLASQEEYRGVMVSLIAELSSTYINLRKYQEELQIAQQNLNSQQELLALTESKYRAGLASRLDAAQAKSLYLQTKATLPAIETAITAQINAIITLTGEASAELQQELSVPTPLPECNEQPVSGLPGELIRQRPDVLAAEHSMEALAAAAGATKADWWPRFYVSGNFGYGSKDFSHFTDKDNMTWQIAPSVSWTLFSGREKVQSTRNAMLKLDEGINDYNNTLLTAIQEVDNTLFAYNRSLVELAALREAFDQTELTFNLAVGLYKQGLSSYQSVLDSQTNRLRYQNALVGARSGMLLYLVQLYKALGGTTPHVSNDTVIPLR